MMSFLLSKLPMAAVLLPSALLVGCATTPGECDPSSANFFNNASCLASGAYAQRQRNLESTLASEQSRNQAFKNLLAGLQTEQTAVRSDLRSRQAAYRRADDSWRQIKRSLAAESAANPALATRIRQIDDDFARAEAGKVAKRDALANKVKLLQRELDAGVYY